MFPEKQFIEAVALQKAGRLEEAKSQYQTLLKQFPGHPRVLYLYGLTLRDSGDPKGATDRISKAISIEPDQAVYHHVLGTLLRQQGHVRPAQERLEEALRLGPEDAITHFDLGDIFMDQGDISRAGHHLDAAIRLQPDFESAWINRGLCYKAGKQLREALQCFQKVVAINPQNAAGNVNLGVTYLLLGQYREGWRYYEWRFQLQPDSGGELGVPARVMRWTGSDLKGKTLLVLAEQGFGDSLQFIRFLEPLKAAGARILLTCPSPLIPLFNALPTIDSLSRIFRFDEPVHYYVPLLSIPGILDTTLHTIPASIPYLYPDPELSKIWHARLQHFANRRVGLVWEGKPLHRNDPLRRRSCTLADLSPLAQLPGISLFSLQKEQPETPLQKPPPGMKITPLGHLLTDFAQTAAALDNLDLLITIDTAIAHLAGAMGKPVWLLLPYAPDWRWSLDQDTTPWYGNMRLFRQTLPERWHEPVGKMVTELHRHRKNGRG